MPPPATSVRILWQIGWAPNGSRFFRPSFCTRLGKPFSDFRPVPDLTQFQDPKSRAVRINFRRLSQWRGVQLGGPWAYKKRRLPTDTEIKFVLKTINIKPGVSPCVDPRKTFFLFNSFKICFRKITYIIKGRYKKTFFFSFLPHT